MIMFDLEKNDQFCEMRIKDRKNLFRFLKDYYIEYKSCLGLDKSMSFGMEIECIFPNKYNNTCKHYDYTSFKLTPERFIGNEGWEFQSPKLYDDDKCWKEVKKTCEYLKKFCIVNERCGGHIHFGADIFQNNGKYFKNLIFLWMAYEDIIYRFGNGEMINTRFSANIYARPTINIFNYFINHDDIFNDNDRFLKFFKNITRNLGLNFNNYFLFNTHESDEKNTVEIRTPNGTLEEVVWQNNVNFFGKLIQTAITKDLDLLKLYFNIQTNNFYDEELLDEYNQMNLDKALELADLIFDNNRDKLDFLKQYIKDGKNTHAKSLVKAKRFWIM